MYRLASLQAHAFVHHRHAEFASESADESKGATQDSALSCNHDWALPALGGSNTPLHVSPINPARDASATARAFVAALCVGGA